MPPVDLSGVRMKYGRGHQHFEAVLDALQRYEDSEPCEVASEEDPRTGVWTWRVSAIRSQPPQAEILGPLGDMMSNFRAALDHLAHQLVLANEGEPTRDTGFPLLCSDSKNWGSYAGKLAGMSKLAKQVIRRYQPCFSTDPRHHQPLRWLEELGRYDRHRLVHLVVASSEGGMLVGTIDGDIFAGEVSEGSVIARATCQLGKRVRFEPLFGAQFAGDAVEAARLPVAYVASEIREAVWQCLQDTLNETLGEQL